MKRCSGCKITKTLDNFTKESRSKDGLRNICKKCQSDYAKERRSKCGDKLRKQSRDWAKANPDGNRDWNYRTKYGISLSEFNSMSQDQEGKCLLCKKVPKDRLVVDHDHSTSKIRGLLCRSCNGALGVLGDTEAKLESVINYLKGNKNEKNSSIDLGSKPGITVSIC